MPRFLLKNKSACLIIIPTAGASVDGMIVPGGSYPVDQEMHDGNFVQTLIGLGDLDAREIEDEEADRVLAENRRVELEKAAKVLLDNDDSNKDGNDDEEDQDTLAEIEALRKQCADMGISVDKRWKVPGLKAAIAKA